MHPAELVSIFTGLLGLLLGTAGFVISVLAFLQDRPKLKVTLNWDMTDSEDPTRRIGVVQVTNIGRRAAYVAMVALRLPRGYESIDLVISKSISGQRVEDGGAPVAFPVHYKDLQKYRADWQRIRAFAEDSTGRAHYSNYPGETPSWAK